MLTNCVKTGESMALDPPIMHNNVAFSFGRIVGAASLSAFFMQLICRPSDIGDVSPIIAPVERSYVVYPPELVLTNLVAVVPVVSITGEIFVFSLTAIESTHAAAAYGMSNAYTVRYKHLFGGRQVIGLRNPIQSFPMGDSFSKRSWDLVLRLSAAITSTLHKGGINQNLSFCTVIGCSEYEWEYIKRRMEPLQVFERKTVSTIRVSRSRCTRELIKTNGTKF